MHHHPAYCLILKHIGDSAGEERFRSINSLYYHGAGAGIIVFDVTKKGSFKSAVDYWIPHLRDHGVEGIIITLIGNKCDLADIRQVSKSEALEVAEREKVHYFETSAKSGKGIMDVFLFIANEVPKTVADQKDDAGFRITQVSHVRNDVSGGVSSGIRLGHSNGANRDTKCC